MGILGDDSRGGYQAAGRRWGNLKKRFVALLCCVAVWVGFSGVVFAAHPAQAIMVLYEDEIRNKETIEPYIISLLALNEVMSNRHTDEVRRFIAWYFQKLNYPDRFGLTGTIYVYVLADGQEVSTHAYDSVDGYSGLFLHLLWQYAERTGDLEMVKNNWSKIEDIAYTLPYLQDKDGLTRALSGSRVKYLMDNCEAYGGIQAYLELRKAVGKSGSKYYRKVRNSIEEGIWMHLYEKGADKFFWAVEEEHKSNSDWKIFYPDGFAQLFPIYYGLVDHRPDLREALWRRFNAEYAEKVSGFPVEQRIMYELTKRKMGGNDRQLGGASGR